MNCSVQQTGWKKLLVGMFICLFVTYSTINVVHAEAEASNAEQGLHLVPWPTSITVGQGFEELTSKSRVMAQTEQLLPLAKVVAEEMYSLSGLKLATAIGKGGTDDIALCLSDAVAEDEGYKLTVGPSGIVVEARTYRGAAWGTVTLAQATSISGGKVRVPRLTIADAPAVGYRGLLIDTARKFHPIETMRSIIVMCRLYKINYLQLHLNDNAGIMVFPFKAYPQLATAKNGKPTTWSIEEVTALAKFADDRGVSIVPELEGPGHHAGNLRELFGRNGIVDVYNEKTYETLDVLIGELVKVFKSSPYIHVGGDEVGGAAGGLGKSPEEIAYKEKNKAGGVTDHYIKRVDEIVKKYGKKSICWEGSGGGGLPKDIIFMPFDSNINANSYIGKGFKVINTAWKPLYVVGGTKFPAEYIYDKWNTWLWEHHTNKKLHVQVKEGSKEVLGAQMCAWEQTADIELPSTRERIHAMSERIWNPKLGKKYTDFAPRAFVTDQRLDLLLNAPVIKTEGLPGVGKSGYHYFSDPITVTIESSPIGTLHYTLDGKDPVADSPKYSGPISLSKDHTKVEAFSYNSRTKSMMDKGPVVHVKARLFDSANKPIGDEVSVRNYWHKSSEEIASEKAAQEAAKK